LELASFTTEASALSKGRYTSPSKPGRKEEVHQNLLLLGEPRQDELTSCHDGPSESTWTA
jgi:hypothetical protein